MKNSTKAVVRGALIAAIYAALTYVAVAVGLAYGPIQFRFSEALTILPVFTPAAIPGLTIGCFLSNLASPYPLDLLCGTAATLLAAVFTRLLRNVKPFGLPILAPLPPVFFNALIVGGEIAFTADAGFSLPAFALAALEVGLGELVVCYILGLTLYLAIEKSGAKRFMFS